jgi:hypothetical protein
MNPPPIPAKLPQRPARDPMAREVGKTVHLVTKGDEGPFPLAKRLALTDEERDDRFEDDKADLQLGCAVHLPSKANEVPISLARRLALCDDG